MKTTHFIHRIGVLLFAVLSLFLLAGCWPSENEDDMYHYRLTINESYDVNLGQHEVDEEEFIISVAPAHAARSTRYLDPENGDEHYVYIPDTGFTGTDYIKIDKCYPYLVTGDGRAVTSPYLEINFTVREL